MNKVDNQKTNTINQILLGVRADALRNAGVGYGPHYFNYADAKKTLAEWVRSKKPPVSEFKNNHYKYCDGWELLEQALLADLEPHAQD